jgi:ABC-type transporter Mla subunit MlaD
MALQDLTPQLRTRLNRMERAVGVFMLLATGLLLFGFGYYIYSTAERRGWFKVKAQFYTYADTGDGLVAGDPIKLMGFQAGQILEVTAGPPWGPGSEHNVYVKFEVVEPYFGYLWSEGSRAQIKEAGFLGKRELDLTKGTAGHAIYVTVPSRDVTLAEAKALTPIDKWRCGEDVRDGTNLLAKAWQALKPELFDTLERLGKKTMRVLDKRTEKKSILSVWNEKTTQYDSFGKSNIFVLLPDEAPALTARLNALATQVETALPHILALTNTLATVLSNAERLTGNLNGIAEGVRPSVTNLAIITANIRDPKGSLGEWIIPTNLQSQLAATLQNANVTITNADTNLVAVLESLTRSLDNLGNITSNLNNQVQANSNILSQLSDIVVHSDQFVQGLKHHWLLRSAFKTPKTNAPSSKVSSQPVQPIRSPKDEQ